MQVLIAFLILLLAAPGPGWSASSVAETARDGSLVLKGEGKSGRNSKESLALLLSKEIEVFIFRHQTRVWPRRSRAAAPAKCGPELEALIRKYSKMYGVDPSLVRAVMRHESGFNPRAVSPKGAQGLMQLMPETAALMGVSNPFDPEQNIAGGVGYLRFCLDRFNNDVALALAAYNAGPERVAKTGGVPPIPETQNYVKNVLTTYTGKPQPLPRKGAHFITPGRSKPSKVIKGAGRNSAKPAAGSDKPKRRRPKIIVVRYPFKKPR